MGSSNSSWYYAHAARMRQQAANRRAAAARRAAQQRAAAQRAAQQRAAAQWAAAQRAEAQRIAAQRAAAQRAEAQRRAVAAAAAQRAAAQRAAADLIYWKTRKLDTAYCMPMSNDGLKNALYRGKWSANREKISSSSSSRRCANPRGYDIGGSLRKGPAGGDGCIISNTRAGCLSTCNSAGVSNCSSPELPQIDKCIHGQTIQGEREGNSWSTCNKCITGYIRSEDQRTCKATPIAGCSKRSPTDGFICLGCNPGYRLTNNTCQVIDIANCANQGTPKEPRCISCAYGYKKSSDEISCVPMNEPHPGEPISGFDGHLRMQKYKGYWDDNKNFFRTAPRIGDERKVKVIHLLDEGDQYSYKIWGVFSPPQTGLYYFKTNSDDSSVMWVDDKKVVDNSTSHGMRMKTGTINLEKGKQYSILMYFGEKTGHSELQFFWSSGGGWTTNIGKFFTSQTYEDIPCPSNFNGQSYTIEKWIKRHGNGDEDVVIMGGDTKGVITIKSQDVDKIKGSTKMRIYPTQPPGGNFFADPIRWRETDKNGNLYLSTGQTASHTPIKINNNNRDCFERALAIYVGTPLPEVVANCREQTILAGRFWCTSCNSGYQKSKDGQNCNLIPIENCKAQKGNICSECNSDYDLSDDRKRCIPEAPAPPILPPPTNKPDNVRGIPGIKGWVGEKGAQGNMGPRGPKGRAAVASEVSGLPGLRGVQGVVGPKGPKGERGLTGVTGYPGITGYQGPTTIHDPWVDNRVVKQLRKMKDRLSDKNKEYDFKSEGERKSVNIRLQMPRNTKRVVKKRILLTQEDDSDIEGFSIYPSGRNWGAVASQWRQ